MSFVAIVAIFLFVNAAIWYTATSKILKREPSVYVGDLARMAYLPELAHPRLNTNTLPREHIKFSDYKGQSCQVITIGDSFSYGLGFGPNRFYQDYIASKAGIDVLNLPPLTNLKDVLQDVVILANSGYLQGVGGKYLVLEFAERNFLTRANADIDFTASLSGEEIDRIYAEKKNKPPFSEELPDVKMVNTGNLKYIVNKIGFVFSEKAIFGDLLKVKLEKNMFSHERGNMLLFLEKDIRKSKYSSVENLSKINENLNKVSDILEGRGIKLVLLIAPNKYSIYSKYIKDSKYKRSTFYDSFFGLDRKYINIDVYKDFDRYCENGGKDLYYIDDTHWSSVASDMVADAVVAVLNN